MFVWLAWLVPWVALGALSSRTVARAGTSAEIVYRIVTAAGAFLLFAFRPRWWLLWNMNTALAWSMLGVAIIGLAFTW